MNIPVFHDDQHGTAIVVCAALVNALKLAEKQNSTIVINGAGSAGVAIATLILKIGLGNVILVDKQGILTADMDLTSGQRGLIDKLNKEGKTGSLKDALVGADVFIGVSAGHIVSKEMIASMNERQLYSQWRIQCLKLSRKTQKKLVPILWVQVVVIIQTKSIMCWLSQVSLKVH